MSRRCLYICAGLTMLVSPVLADVTFSGSAANPASGNTDDASVMFSLAGSTLTVVLSNTTTAADINKKFVPTDVLTAVFFGTQQIAATPISATLTNGSSEIDPNGSKYSGTQPLGGEWGYADNISIADGNATLLNGISSSGLNGLFGHGNFGCTTGKNGTCDSLSGIPWGIVPTPFPPPQGINSGVAGPVESNSVTFALTVGQGFSLNSIQDVRFQYGTATTEFFTQGTEGNGQEDLPEPRFGGAVGMILGTLLLWQGWQRRRALTQFLRITSI